MHSAWFPFNLFQRMCLCIMCIIQTSKINMQDSRLCHSPGSDRSSPAWGKEVRGAQGAPGGSRSTPGPARTRESLLSASCQRVWQIVSEVRRWIPKKSLLFAWHSHSALSMGTGHWPVFCVQCIHSLSQPSKKQTSQRAKFFSSVSHFGSWPLKQWISEFWQHL